MFPIHEIAAWLKVLRNDYSRPGLVIVKSRQQRMRLKSDREHPNLTNHLLLQTTNQKNHYRCKLMSLCRPTLAEASFLKTSAQHRGTGKDTCTSACKRGTLLREHQELTDTTLNNACQVIPCTLCLYRLSFKCVSKLKVFCKVVGRVFLYVVEKMLAFLGYSTGTSFRLHMKLWFVCG